MLLLAVPAKLLYVLSITGSLSVLWGFCQAFCGDFVKPGALRPQDSTICSWLLLIVCSCRGSIDCIQLINEEHMVSGADDG